MSQHLENADNAMTAITIGSAAVAGAASQVAPPRVKQAIASGRKKCSRWFDKAKKKYRRTYLVITVLNAMLNVSLYFLDIFTDVVLLVTFLVHGWFWSSVGSITFIALPYLLAMYGIVRTRKQALKDYIDWDPGYDTCKKVLFFLLSPILPLVFDVFLMPFHGFMGRCIGDNLSNFMTQYEATRTLSETLLESLPQLFLQLYMVGYCRTNGCNFEAEEGGDAALMQALVISISSIVYRLVTTCFEMQREHLTLREYITQLVRMGDGLPLNKIANNNIPELNVDFELTAAQVRLLARVLADNTSLVRMDLQWKGLDEESTKVLVDTRHPALNWNGNAMVILCEKGYFDSVKAMVEGHDVEKTGISVDEMVSKEGKNSRGWSRTPLQSAAEKEQLEIVQFLVKTCTNKVDIIGQTNSDGWNSLHLAAELSKKNVQTLQCLIDNYNGNIKTIINQKDNYGFTPLDYAYTYNKSPIKNEIVSLLRKYGGKANNHDKNGNEVGEGKGDLNH